MEALLTLVVIIIALVAVVLGVIMGVTLLPVAIPVFILWLCIAAPAWGLPLLFVGLLFLLFRKA